MRLKILSSIIPEDLPLFPSIEIEFHEKDKQEFDRMIKDYVGQNQESIDFPAGTDTLIC